MMQCGMRADTQDFKVFQPIIVFDAIAVVNMLVGTEASPHMPFHNDTVFKQIRTANSNRDIPI